MATWVAWVIMEHLNHLTQERNDIFEQSRQYFATICGYKEVKMIHYTESLKSEIFTDCCAMVLSGSSALWESHDLNTVKKFGEIINSLNLPVFGICAGHQALAIWNGGAVGNMRNQNHGYTEERGYQKIQILKSEAIFKGLESEVIVNEVCILI
jgi:GMP synthase-like glutamine amidotransferase